MASIRKSAEEASKLAQLLLNGVRDGRLELVAESKLEGYPYDAVNRPPKALDKAYFTLYCYDPVLIPAIEKAGLVAKSRSTGISMLEDGRQAARYKLHGDFEKVLLEGVSLADDRQHYLKFEQKEKGQINLVRQEIDGNRKTHRVATVSCESFGPNRLFVPLPKDKLRHYRMALAKAAEQHGMSDVLLLRSRRDQDVGFDALEESGLYRHGTPRFVYANPDHTGMVYAIYIPRQIADSIRATQENQSIDFVYDSPDIPALNNAIDHTMEPTEELLRFIDGEQSVEELCRLAAKHWPNVPEQGLPDATAEKQMPDDKPAAHWRKPMHLLLREAGIGPQHYTIIKTCQADGQYNYRLQVNEDTEPRIANRDLWMIADSAQCQDVLKLEHANLNYGPERLRITPDADEKTAQAEIERLEKALWGKKIQVEEVPFQLQPRGLNDQDVIFMEDKKRNVQRMAIKGMELATAMEDGKEKHFLILAAPHLGRLSERHLNMLGLKKGMTARPLTVAKEVPALVAIEIAPHVAQHITQQRQENQRMQSLMRQPGGAALPDFLALSTAMRHTYQVMFVESTVSSIIPVHVSGDGGAQQTPKDKEDTEREPLDLLMATLKKYPAHSILVQRVQSVDEETHQPAVHHCLTVVQPASGNNYDRLAAQMMQLIDEDGDIIMDAQDMRRIAGFEKKNELFQINYLPEDVLEAIEETDRPIAIIDADGADPDALAEQARAHFRLARQTSIAEISKKDERPILEQLATKSMCKVAVRYPDAAQWQDYCRQFEEFVTHASQWEGTPVTSRHANQNAILFAQGMERISPAVQTMLRGVMAVNSGVSYIHDGLPALVQAQHQLQEETHWRTANLDQYNTAEALLIPDVGKRTHTLIGELEKQGMLSRKPYYVEYKKQGETRHKRLKKTSACIIYPTPECLRQLVQYRGKERELSALTLLPEWAAQTEQNHTAGLPVLLAQDVGSAVQQHYDVQAIAEREEALRKPKRAIEQASDFMIRTMSSQALLLRERYDNPLDGRAEAGRRRKVQGVGVDQQEKGSQLVLVAMLDARNIKSFLRQVYDPLQSTNLLAGQKIYEARTVQRPRTLSNDEQEILSLRQRMEDVGAMVQQQDLTFRSKEQFREICQQTPSMLEALKGELRLSLRIFEKLQTSNPTLQATLLSVAQHPESAASVECPAMLLWPAILVAHGITASTLGNLDQMWQSFQKAAQEMTALHQQLRAQLQHKEDQASISRTQVKTHDTVLGVAHAAAGLYDLKGNLLSEQEIEQQLSEHKTVVVKCYLSPECEELSSQMKDDVLRQLKSRLARQVDMTGRSDDALPQGEVLEQAKGKYTSRLRTEHDLKRQLHHALSNDNAITAHEVATLMGLHFDSSRERGR